MISPMKTLRTAALLMCTAGMTFGLSACAPKDMGSTMTGPELSKPNETIVGIATGDNMAEVSTLVKLVKQAGLVDALSSAGPFTVFAPTNEAFEAFKVKYPEKYKFLIDPANKAKLAEVLEYHVLKGKHMAADVTTMTSDTLDGTQQVMITKDGDMVTVGNGDGITAKVIKPDIVASNGVIHWIDTVLVPPNMMK
jgi:uncharacterized surface protein with fasciclin (FAS1) repeats